MSELFARMRELGHPIFSTCTFRSVEEQNAEYAQGRTAAGRIVTHAKGGQSPHNFGMACDLAFVLGLYNGPWELVGKVAREVGLVWGGDWRRLVDKPHVERKNWKKYVQVA